MSIWITGTIVVIISTATQNRSTEITAYFRFSFFGFLSTRSVIPVFNEQVVVSLFFSGKKVNLNHLKHIISFPSKSHFSNLIDDLLDIKKISRNWETSQNIINKEKKIKIFKTHNMLCRFGNNYFTNVKNTISPILLVIKYSINPKGFLIKNKYV